MDRKESAEELLRSASPISIWTPAIVNKELCFVRPPIRQLGDHYSTKESFFKQKQPGTTRICLFGESAAAGYLLAPHLTPAKVISRSLALTEREFEVLDFSRTNENLVSLINTVEASCQLEPDVLVVWIGNNLSLLEFTDYSFYGPNKTMRDKLMEDLVRDGILRLKEKFASEIINKTGEALQMLKAIADKAECKVVIIVPEVNLKNWANVQPLARPFIDKASEWYQSYYQAIDALEEKDFKQVQNCATRMFEIDDFTNPTSLGLFGLALMENGHSDEALEVLRLSVDSNDYLSSCFLAAPMINVRLQKFLRKSAEALSFLTVDIEEVLRTSTGRNIFGCEDFLDYCHHTADSIQVISKRIAMKIFNSTHVTEKEDYQIEDLVLYIKPSQLAVSYLASAIHAAHRHPSYNSNSEIISYWISKAIEADGSIIEIFKPLVNARISRVPIYLTKHQREIFLSDYTLLDQHGLNYDYVDAELLCVLIDTLQRNGIGLEKIIDEEVLDEESEIELCPFYLWEPIKRYFPELMNLPEVKRYSFVRFPWPHCSFAIVRLTSASLEFTMELRIPESNKSMDLEIKFNSIPIAILSVSNQWQILSFQVPGEYVRKGVNKLKFVWPVNQSFVKGLVQPYHPVFGEIFSLRVKQVQD